MEISVLTALNQGLMWGILAIGVFVSFKVLDFADMTCEGSIALGGAITAVTLQAGLHPILAVLFALLGGAGAGLITGLLHTKLRIPPILSGILTMTALYSINLRIMKDRASITMLNVKTLTSGLTDALVNSGLAYKYSVQMSNMIIALIFVALVIGAIYWFFGTEFGCTIRATGMNPKMCRAQGINTNTTIIVGLMISNALIALAGCLISQMQFNTTVSMGTGAIVIGLASIIIGEALTGKKFSFWARLIMLIVGSILYRLVITMVLMIPGFNTNDLKLLTAIVVAVALAIPAIKGGAKPLIQKFIGKKGGNENA
ncbi:MAG: ABC transporter permease [Clostridia bacterium]|nr:ABC transporter permease [Clostridia bacterium]MBQ9108017.1 ABC transporter permease [Clostridia bacterium]MBR2919373.1 ABC transporter permease [Clostridia bacterium]